VTIAYAIDLTADGAVASLGRVGAAAEAALGFIKDLGQGLLEMSAAGAARSAEMAKLSEMVNRNSVSAEAAAKNFDAFAGAVDKLELAGFAREDVVTSLGDYVALTGDAASATEDLTLAAGIATTTSQSLEEATREIAKARQGDIGALKELGAVTEDQRKQLEGIKDESKRVATAMEILQARFSGVAMQSATATQSVAMLSQSKDRLFAKMGQVVNQSGVLQSVLGPLNDLFLEASEYIDDNSVMLQHLVQDGLMYATAAADGAIEVVGFLAKSFADLKFAGDITIAGIKLMASTIELELRRTARTGGEQVQDLSGHLRTLLENAQATAAALGATGQAEMFGAALEQLDKADAKLEDLLAKNAEAGQQAAEAQAAAIKEGAQASEDWQANYEKIDKLQDKAEGVTDKIRANLAEQRANTEAIEDHSAGTAKQTQRTATNTKKAAKHTKAQKQHAESLLDIMTRTLDNAFSERVTQMRLDALEQETELQRALANLEADRVEVWGDKELTQTEKLLELKRLEREEEQLRADATEERLKKREDEAKARAKAFQDEQRQQAELFGQAAAALDSFGGASDFPVVTALGEITQAGFAATQQFHKMRAAGEQASAAAGAAAAGAASIIGGAIAQQIKDTQKAAKIRAAFAAAESTLYFATGNVPAGIGAAIAAAQHLAVAAGAGSSSSGDAAAGRASTQSAARFRSGQATGARESARARSNRSFVEQSSRSSGQGGTVIEMNFRDTRVMSDDPRFMEQLFDGVEREGRRRGIRFQRPGRSG
jgi:hypothetical protein